MDMNKNYEPSPDFVSKTMRRVYDFEASKSSFFKNIKIYGLLQRNALALCGALFGVLTATHVF